MRDYIRGGSITNTINAAKSDQQHYDECYLRALEIKNEYARIYPQYSGTGTACKEIDRAIHHFKIKAGIL